MYLTAQAVEQRESMNAQKWNTENLTIFPVKTHKVCVSQRSKQKLEIEHLSWYKNYVFRIDKGFITCILPSTRVCYIFPGS